MQICRADGGAGVGKRSEAHRVSFLSGGLLASGRLQKTSPPEQEQARMCGKPGAQATVS